MNKAFSLLLSAFIFFANNDLRAQDNVWKTLSKLTYKKQYDEMLGFKVN